LLSNCLASDLKLDCLPVKLNETADLTHQIGNFPQSLGNIPHRKNPSASLEPFPAVIDFVGLQVAEPDGTTPIRRKIDENLDGGRRFGSRR
jgi:hypothetical protein